LTRKVGPDVSLDGASLTLADVAAVAQGRRGVRLDEGARGRMARSFAWVMAAAGGEVVDAQGQSLPVYGVNTGYGSLARERIPSEQVTRISWNLIQSHAAGVGPDLPHEQVRAMMLLRANTLAKGASGCKVDLVDTLIAMLNAGVVPVVPSRGSCGSSGDLAPLAHLGLVVFVGPDGEDGAGRAWFKGALCTAEEAMAQAGIDRRVPGPKEGLAMTNGAQLTTAITALVCEQARGLVVDAEIAAALTWEALRGVTRALHPEVQALRPFPGALACASNLRTLLDGSTLADGDPDRIQDAYSLRCAPQVLGAVRDALVYAVTQVSVELNAVTDNPVILVDEPDQNKAFSAGLFHGEPIGFAADHLKVALTELASIAERRVYRLTTGTLSSRLPPLLPKLDRPSMGLMMPQTVAASLVAACRQRAFPNSVDSLPTCEDQEDHVAMSTTAARRADEILDLARKVVSVELLAAARGIRWRLSEESGQLGHGTRAAYEALQPCLQGTPGEMLESIEGMLTSGVLRDHVRQVVPLMEVTS
jgi:histidine ammonia-lyase